MFRFENPTYLYALTVVPLLLLLFVFSMLRARRRLRRFADADMLPSLASLRSEKRLFAKWIISLLALSLLIVMWARPQFGLGEQSKTTTGIEAVICMDVSNSMAATDVQPSRLERAKLLVSSLIDRMQNDKVALNIFAGEAYPQVPITSDFASAKMWLNVLEPGSVTLQGTNIGAAIDLAQSQFSDNKKVGKAIIVITDGEDHEENAVDVAAKAAKNGYKIYILGVGTAQGSLIPTSNGPLTDESGQPVISKLNEEMCRNIAKAGNGDYIHVDNTNNAWEQLQSKLETLQKSSSTTTYTAYDEQFQAFGLLAIILLGIGIFMFDAKNPFFKRFKKQ